MRELFVAEAHRTLGSFVRQHGTGGLALVKYWRVGVCLVHVEESTIDLACLIPVDGPVIEDTIKWLISLDDAEFRVEPTSPFRAGSRTYRRAKKGE